MVSLRWYLELLKRQLQGAGILGPYVWIRILPNRVVTRSKTTFEISDPFDEGRGPILYYTLLKSALPYSTLLYSLLYSTLLHCTLRPHGIQQYIACH